jgi:hypothetical protein
MFFATSTKYGFYFIFFVSSSFTNRGFSGCLCCHKVEIKALSGGIKPQLLDVEKYLSGHPLVE